MKTTDQKGSWAAQKEKLKKKFTILTDKDLAFEAGRKELMLGKLQEKLGKSKAQLDYILRVV